MMSCRRPYWRVRRKLEPQRNAEERAHLTKSVVCSLSQLLTSHTDHSELTGRALAASMVDTKNEEVVEESEDEELEKANEAFQASREAFREEERRRREGNVRNAVAGPSSSTTATAPSLVTDSTRPDRSSLTNASIAPPVPAPAATSAATTPTTTARSLLGDRAQMEQERLARIAARQGAQSGPTAQPSARPPPANINTRPSHVATLGDYRGSDIHPSRSAYTGQAVNGSSSSKGLNNPYHPLQSIRPFPNDAAGEYFLDGELRHTFVDPQLVGEPKERTFTVQAVVGNVSLKIHPACASY